MPEIDLALYRMHKAHAPGQPVVHIMGGIVGHDAIDISLLGIIRGRWWT